MRKIIAAAMTVIAAVSIVSAQSRAMEKYSGTMIEGRPFFTDAGNYNSYDLFGSPAGLFDAGELSRFGILSEYRYYGLGDETAHYLSGQRLRFGEPGRMFVEAAYGPDIMSNDNGGNEASLLLHRFGLTLATQSSSEAIRTAITVEGYIGTQDWEEGGNSRQFFGVRKFRFDMGSRVHPLFRLNFFAEATALFDSLIFTPRHEEKSFQMNLPEFGASVDFGGDDVPIRSNMSFTYALSRFVYTLGQRGVEESGRNYNAVLNDSLRFTWLAHANIALAEEATLRPGLIFGVSNNSGVERYPADDGYPFNIGGDVPGRTYGLSGIHFGAGTGVDILKYASVHAEHTLSAMSLKLGDAFETRPYVDKRALHGTTFGLSTPVHKYVEIPFEITPRVAYFISGAAGIVGAAHSSLSPLNHVIPPDGVNRHPAYSPDKFLTGFTRLNGFTFGIDGRALEDNMLSASFWMTFLSRKTGGEKDSGMELGLSVELSL